MTITTQAVINVTSGQKAEGRGGTHLWLCGLTSRRVALTSHYPHLFLPFPFPFPPHRLAAFDPAGAPGTLKALKSGLEIRFEIIDSSMTTVEE